jgi:hypothetical protein
MRCTRIDVFSVVFVACWGILAAISLAADPLYSIERTVARQGFDKEMCWVHARAGAIPPGTDANPASQPLVVMTTQKLQLSGSDVFYALHEMRTADLGRTWSDPQRLASFAREPFTFRNQDDLEITVCDFTPRWHAKTGKLLGTGQTVVYQNNRVMHVRPRGTAYAVYRPAEHAWSPWRTLEMPDAARFENAGAGSVQRYDLRNGDILLPIYFKAIGEKQYATTVLRCTFDGETLRYAEHGNEMTVPVQRGLCEPSLTQVNNRFYLTMRNDERGYVSVSDDGLQYSQPKPWTFDDGSDLGNYNTQQHWASHGQELFLVYTRRGADNDHVFRHRAPLFIARVDPKTLCIVRESEQVLVPEKGARLGNFGVTDVSDEETWVTVTEWMQGSNSMIQRGADNRIWVAKIKWRK